MVYLEPYWRQTQADIYKSGYPVIFVDRDGVGSMSKAFNTCIPKIKDKFKENMPEYLFFVTNIRFDKNLIDRLIYSMDSSGFGAIHPVHESHHKSHRYDGHEELIETKFIEWTAPIVRTDLFLKLNLNENYRYWYFDLVWSFYAKKMGYKVGVDHGARIDHKYLLDNKTHIISKTRDELRWYYDPEEKKSLIKEFGFNWKDLLMKDVVPVNKENFKQTIEELLFWKNFVKTDRFLKDWLSDSKTAELDIYVADFIRSINHNSILDVGSGPVSILHGLIKDSSITAADPLSFYYQKIFNYKKYKISSPESVSAEDLCYKEQFDITHISNALDHCKNPRKVIENMYNATKKGGYLIIQTFEREGTEQKWKAFHQWDIFYSSQGIYLKGKDSEKELLIENNKIYKMKRQRKLYNRIWTILIIKKT